MYTIREDRATFIEEDGETIAVIRGNGKVKEVRRVQWNLWRLNNLEKYHKNHNKYMKKWRKSSKK